MRSNYIVRATADLTRLRRPGDPPFHFAVASKWLDVLEQVLVGAARREVQSLRPLVAAAQTRPLDDEERRRLDERLTRLLEAMRRQYDEDRQQLRRLRKAL